MAPSTRILFTVLTCGACGAWALADEAKPESAAAESAPAEPAADAAPAAKGDAAKGGNESEVAVGTRLYDAATVGELFDTYEAENKRRAEALTPHLSSGDMQIIELAPVEMEAYHMRHMDDLSERLDPRPQRRLARLAELDPKAAADLRVSMRAEERFMAGETDATYDANAGRTADVDFREVASSVLGAAQRMKDAAKPKKVTDDQPDTPATE